MFLCWPSGCSALFAGQVWRGDSPHQCPSFTSFICTGRRQLSSMSAVDCAIYHCFVNVFRNNFKNVPTGWKLILCLLNSSTKVGVSICSLFDSTKSGLWITVLFWLDLQNCDCSCGHGDWKWRHTDREMHNVHTFHFSNRPETPVIPPSKPLLFMHGRCWSEVYYI